MFFFSFIETMIYLLFLYHDNCRCMFFNTYTDKAQTVLQHNDNKSGFVFIVQVKHLLQLSLSCHDKGRS